MKNILLSLALSTLALSSFAAPLTNAQRSEVFSTMSDLEAKASKTDRDTLHNEVFYASEAQLQERLVKLIYQCESSVDNPNSLDLQDLKMGLARKSVMQLVDYAKASPCTKQNKP